LTAFKKGVSIKGKLPSNYPMVESTWVPAHDISSTEFNKHSLSEIDQVLDDVIEFNPAWGARLQRIIEDSK
jgi:hypothetical protein